MAINYSVDYYELIGVAENCSGGKLKATILRLFQKLDVEVRTTIPQRIQKEAKGELRKRLRREPTELEEQQYLYEKTQDADTSKRDKVYVETTEKLQLVNEARETLLDDSKKRRYDESHNRDRQVTCHDHTTGVYGAKVKTKWFNRSDPRAQKRNSCYFCSSLCLNEHLKAKSSKTGTDSSKKKVPNTGNAPCYKCKTKAATGWKKRTKNGRWYCQSCYDAVPFCVNCKTKKGWSKIAGRSERVCSQACSNAWIKKNKSDSKGDNKPPNIVRLRQLYLQELTSLEGWELLTEDEKDKFKKMIISGFSESKFKDVIFQVETLISKKEKEDSGGGGGDSDKNLPAEIQKAIREIEAELNKEPKITLKEQNVSQSGVNWKVYIETSANVEELKSRKQEVLTDIQRLRKQAILTKFRAEVITKIKEELARDPKVATEELEKPDWEATINTLVEKGKIEILRDEILANIIQLRKNKTHGSNLEKLIQEAQTAAASKDWEKLGDLLEKIKDYEQDPVYKSQSKEIERLEKILVENNFPKYQQASLNSLENFLKDGVTIKKSDLKPENQNFAQAIAQAKSKEEIATIVENVKDDAGTSKANITVNNLLVRAENAASDNEKSVIRQEAELLKNGNKWEKAIFNQRNSDFEKIFSAWEASANEEFKNIPSVSSQEKNPHKPKDNSLPIILLLIVVCGIIICSLLLVIRRKKRI